MHRVLNIRTVCFWFFSFVSTIGTILLLETVGRVGECTQMEKVEVDAPLDVIKPGMEQAKDPTGI